VNRASLPGSLDFVEVSLRFVLLANVALTKRGACRHHVLIAVRFHVFVAVQT
jgi:hypothetical protein